MILTTASWLGGRNDFLGIAFLTVGGACFIFSIGLAVMQSVRRRKLGDTSCLSWNRTAAAYSANPIGPGSADNEGSLQ